MSSEYTRPVVFNVNYVSFVISFYVTVVLVSIFCLSNRPFLIIGKLDNNLVIC